MAEVEIKGLKELLAAMKELPKAVEKKVMRQAVAAGAVVIRKSAQDLVRQRTGLVKRAVRIGFNRNESTPGKVVYHVFVSLKVKGIGEAISGSRATTKKIRAAGNKGKMRDAFYWRFLELGTSKMGAKPFMRPAFDSTNHEAAATITSKMAAGVEAEAAKLGK